MLLRKKMGKEDKHEKDRVDSADAVPAVFQQR